MGGMLHDLAQDTDSYCMKIQSFFVDKLAGTVLSDGREFTCYRVFRMRKHSSDENSLYIGMQELIRKAINAGEFRGSWFFAEFCMNGVCARQIRHFHWQSAWNA